MNFQNIEFPCLLGSDIGVIRIKDERDLRNWLHGFEANNIAYLKHGYNPKLRPKFLITCDGTFREFVPKSEQRKWSKYLFWLWDFSKIKCNVELNIGFSSEELHQYLQRNITSLDKHFSQAMRLYKVLKSYEPTEPLTVEQLCEIIKKV